MIEFPKSIKDGDIELIKLEPTFENARRIFDVVNADREFLRKWLEWVDKTNSPEDAYPHMVNVSQVTDPNYYIVYKNSLAGSVGFVDFSERCKSGEIGYWLAQKFNGLGIMTRSVKMLENFAFKNLGLVRIQIGADVENIPSQNVAKRAGYMQEGVARQSFVMRGKSCDIIVFSKLKSEWEKGK